MLPPSYLVMFISSLPPPVVRNIRKEVTEQKRKCGEEKCGRSGFLSSKPGSKRMLGQAEVGTPASPWPLPQTVTVMSGPVQIAGSLGAETFSGQSL